MLSQGQCLRQACYFTSTETWADRQFESEEMRKHNWFIFSYCSGEAKVTQLTTDSASWYPTEMMAFIKRIICQNRKSRVYLNVETNDAQLFSALCSAVTFTTAWSRRGAHPLIITATGMSVRS